MTERLNWLSESAFWGQTRYLIHFNFLICICSKLVSQMCSNLENVSCALEGKKKKKCILLLFIGMSAAAAASLQSCPILCDPIDSSPPGSPVPGILQARILECVAISLSSALKWKVKVKLLTHVWLLATPWTAAYQAPPSMGFSRQEYWSGMPLPFPIGMSSRYQLGTSDLMYHLSLEFPYNFSVCMICPLV